MTWCMARLGWSGSTSTSTTASSRGEHGEVPHEALRIAQLMGLDDELLASCRAFLSNDAQGGE